MKIVCVLLVCALFLIQVKLLELHMCAVSNASEIVGTVFQSVVELIEALIYVFLVC